MELLKTFKCLLFIFELLIDEQIPTTYRTCSEEHIGIFHELQTSSWNLKFKNYVFLFSIVESMKLLWHGMSWEIGLSFNSRPLYLKWFIVDPIMNLIRPHLKFHTENCEDVICIFVSGIFRLKKYFHFTKVLTLF